MWAAPPSFATGFFGISSAVVGQLVPIRPTGNMKWMSIVCLLLLGGAQAQFFNTFSNIFRPVMNLFSGPSRPLFGRPSFSRRPPFSGGRPGRFRDDGTQRPQASGKDELLPGDCGIDEKGMGKLCFPDGLLCQNSKYDYSLEKSLGKPFSSSYRRGIINERKTFLFVLPSSSHKIATFFGKKSFPQL